MSAGDRWQMPNGQDGIELERQGGLLRLAPIVEHWPFPAPPVIVSARQCKRQPSRYLNGAVPEEEDALL